MNSSLQVRLLVLLLSVCLAFGTIPAKAEIKPLGQYDIGPSKGQAIGVLVAVIAVGAAIGIGTYLLVRKAPTLTGCAVSSQNGLQLQNEGDQKTYMLTGDTAGITAGDRVRIRGKKKKNSSGTPNFLVDQLRKDYGSCKAQPPPID